MQNTPRLSNTFTGCQNYQGFTVVVLVEFARLHCSCFSGVCKASLQLFQCSLQGFTVVVLVQFARLHCSCFSAVFKASRSCFSGVCKASLQLFQCSLQGFTQLFLIQLIIKLVLFEGWLMTRSPMQQDVIFSVCEQLFPALYTNIVQFMTPKMDVSILT